MTTTKGSSLAIFPIVIKEKFGEEAYAKWLAALPEESKKIFSGITLASNWYPVTAGLVEPTKVLSEICYSGDIKTCCSELGTAVAEHTMKGIFRMFLKLGSPEFLLGKVGTIFATVYDSCKIETEMAGKGKAMIKLKDFEDIHEIIEMRIQAIFKRTAEFIGCKNVKVEIVKSAAKGAEWTEFEVTWED